MTNDNGNHTTEPKLFWDIGTAYDLFVSLTVLHDPAAFGLRAAWAAGMRSRLPAEERESLEQYQGMKFGKLPFHWLSQLPDPKDGRAVLSALRQVPAEQRLPLLVKGPDMPEQAGVVLDEVAQAGSWDDAQVDDIIAAYRDKNGDHQPTRGPLEILLEWWSDLEASGERLFAALRTYYDVFFAEEEQRIRPALDSALGRAQALAAELSVPDLLEELSQGVRLEQVDSPELVLAPSYWGTPLIIFGMASKEREAILFGARPAQASLVPGEMVPDALLQALKALSDPTRLRILYYLSEQPLTPSQLARRLRLRSSTVTHHLDLLRLATLVQFRVGGEGKDRRYAVRQDAINSVFAALEGFLGQAEMLEVAQLQSRPQKTSTEAQPASD